MKRIKQILIATIVVLFINSMFIFIFGYCTENVYCPAEENSISIEKVILYENEYLNLEDYKLLNWDYGDKKESADDIISILSKTKYSPVSKLEQVGVRFFQNRFNSIIQICYSPDPEYKYTTEWRKKSENTATNIEIVKLFGHFYLIADYMIEDSVTDNNKTGEKGTKVYKADIPEDISDVVSFKGDNEYFASYSFYPILFSPYVSTIFGKILNALLVIGEIFVVYFIYRKLQLRNNN